MSESENDEPRAVEPVRPNRPVEPRLDLGKAFTAVYVFLAVVALGGVFTFANLLSSDVRVETQTVSKTVVPGSYDELVVAIGNPTSSPTPQELGASGYKTCGIWALGDATQVISCK